MTDDEKLRLECVREAVKSTMDGDVVQVAGEFYRFVKGVTISASPYQGGFTMVGITAGGTGGDR